MITTIGLVIHSLADGSALGATLFCNLTIKVIRLYIVSDKGDAANAGLGVLIFFAILLHKAPASIGFGTFL